MTGSGWRIRLGSPRDRELLASFTCAEPAVGSQAEVEQFVQAELIDWVLTASRMWRADLAAELRKRHVRAVMVTEFT